MYEQFYGFSELPFNITPDPRFLFLSHGHEEAFSHLLFGVTERKGFIQFTGEVGTGKTTLCRAFLDSLGPEYQTAVILNPCMTGAQLLRSILVELGLPPGRNDRVHWLAVLNRFLLEEADQGHDVVLVIDEAQDLSTELLEQLRLLSNLETDRQKLLQIVLIGQPELMRLLDEQALDQLRQRITVRYHLTPMNAEETGQYIEHRLQLVSTNGVPSFSRPALRRIFRYSGGVPRRINAVCDKALLCGYVEGESLIRLQHLRRAIRELEGRIRR